MTSTARVLRVQPHASAGALNIDNSCALRPSFLKQREILAGGEGPDCVHVKLTNTLRERDVVNSNHSRTEYSNSNTKNAAFHKD